MGLISPRPHTHTTSCSIASHRSKKQRLPEQYIWKYFCQITKALAYMHDQRVMHRDVKPENVLVQASGHLKLIDFGTAKLVGRSPGSSESSIGAKNKWKEFVGTPEYMEAYL